MTLYSMAADFIVVIHLAYAAFIVIGLLLILVGAVRKWSWVRNFWFRAVHLVMIGIVAAEAICGLPCPLTEWEAQLRRRAGEATYAGSFIGHWAERLLFFDAPSWVFSTAHIGFFLLVLLALAVAPPRWPFSRSSDSPPNRSSAD